MSGGGGGMNTKRSRAVSRGRGGSADESPSFQIKDGEIVIVGDTKASEGEKEQYYIRLDQEGVVPPPFDRSLIGKAEDDEQRGGVPRTSSRKKKTAHKKRQGLSRKGSMRYINIPSSIGIALDSVKAARLKSTFYDKLYQEKKAREEKLLANSETTEESRPLSSDTCEKALAKVRKSRSGPFYLNHLSLYVKSTDNEPNQCDLHLDAGGSVNLKSRSPSHSMMESDKAISECDNLYFLIQRSRNSKPRDLPITNDKSASTGIFYKAKSEKIRRQSRWSTPDSILSCPSSYNDSPKIVNAVHDWVECDVHCAPEDAQHADKKSTVGEEQELENARDKAIREATALDFKSLKIKLDFLLRNNSKTSKNQLARSASNQKSPDLETFIPLQIADVLCPKPTAALSNQRSKRSKKAYKKSPQRQRKQADSQIFAKSPKKHVAFTVLDSPLECSNNRSDTADNDATGVDDKPRINQTSEPDTRGVQLISVSLGVSQHHGSQQLSQVSEISGASEKNSSTMKSTSLPASRVKINTEEQSKGKYLTTAIGQKARKPSISRYLLKKSPTKDADVTCKVSPSKKPLKISSDNALQTENMKVGSTLSPKCKAKRSEHILKTSPQRGIRHESSHEVKNANRTERVSTPDRLNKLPPPHQGSFTDKDRCRATTKRNTSGQKDCQASASFSKVTDTSRWRILSEERRKPIQQRSPKLSPHRAEGDGSRSHESSAHSKNEHEVLTRSPEEGTKPLECGISAPTEMKSFDPVAPGATGISTGNNSPALGENIKLTVCRLQRRTSDPMSLRLKRLVRNRLSDIVGQRNKSPVNSPVKSELREMTTKLTICRRTSDPPSLTTQNFKGRKSLSEIPNGKKKLSVGDTGSKSYKGPPETVERKDQSPRCTGAYKADMDTEAVKSAVHQRLYGSVSSQSISGSGSSHVKGFQKFKAMTRSSFSDKDVTETMHGGKGGKWKGYTPMTKLDSPVDVIAENSRSPKLSDTLTTVNEVSFEFAGEDLRAQTVETLATSAEVYLLSPRSSETKTGSRLTGFYRHRRKGVDKSSKGDDASQKNTYLDMLFSEVIPKAKNLQKRQIPDEADLSSSVDPDWFPKTNTNPADSYFVQPPIIKPEVYEVSEMLTDLRKVRTNIGKSGDLHETRETASIKHVKILTRNDLARKPEGAAPRPSRIMSTNKMETIEEHTKMTRISFRNTKSKTGITPTRPFATPAQKSLGDLRSSKCRSLKESSLESGTKSTANLGETKKATKPSVALRINGSALKNPAHERVLRTNVRQAHLSKNTATKRQTEKLTGPATKAPPLKVKNDARLDKTPLPAKPRATELNRPGSKTNPTQTTAKKKTPKEGGEQPVEQEDIYTEPPSEAARRQKLAYMNYVKTGTRLVFPENTIQVIKYISQLGVEDADTFEALPTSRSGKRPLKLKSPPAADLGEPSEQDTKKTPGNEAGDIGLGSYSAEESKRYTSATRKSGKSPKPIDSKSVRSKVSTVADDNKTRRDAASKLISGSSASGLTKSGTSPGHAKKSGLASKLTEQGATVKRSEKMSAQQGRPSRCSKTEVTKNAAPLSRKRVIRTVTLTKACAVKCRKKSSFKPKEGTAPTGNSQAFSDMNSVGKHGNLPIARRKSLRKRLRKPRGELTFVENRCDSVKRASLTHSVSHAHDHMLAVGFEENIIKLADNLLKPGQKFLNLAYDSIMNLVHFKRNSRAKTTEPSASPPEKRSLKKKRATKKTKIRVKKQCGVAKSPALAACSRPDFCGLPEDHSRSPEGVPSSSVDAPCPPVEAEARNDLTATPQENLPSLGILK